jgi:methylmalonyl-CoA mutase C-terminal domain/subunit
MVDALADAGLNVPVVIGGIVPDEDRPALAAAGVAGVLGPGAPADEVVACVRAAAASRGR